MRLEELHSSGIGSLLEWGNRGNRTNAPGWGNGFRGMGAQLFSRPYYGQIGIMINREHEGNETVKKALTGWFMNAFQVDKPNIDPEIIREAMAEGTGGKPRWQERHFYHLAHMIKATPDRHMAEYICSWLSDFFGDHGSAGFNEYFQPARWYKFCEIPMPVEPQDD